MPYRKKRKKKEESLPSFEGRRTVFVCGIFNVLHPGHVRFLNFAAEQGDVLIVGVFNDAMVPRGTNPEVDRLGSIKSIKVVNHAFILREPPEAFIKKYKPLVMVKGREFEAKDNPERSILESYGGELVFSSGELKLSSFDEINERSGFRNLVIEKPQDYFTRHKLDKAFLVKALDKFADIRVCIIGDTIIDEYATCEPLGMSREDPTVVVRPIQNELFIGGAGIVAAHCHALGAKVDFITVVGGDKFGKIARRKLADLGVPSLTFEEKERPTTHKKRYRATGKTMLRVNTYSQQPIKSRTQAKIIAELEGLLKDTDLLIFADFNYGALPQPMVNVITTLAKKNGVMIAADSQASSQVGDVSRFSGAKLITPTEYEARIAMKDFDDGLVTLAERLRNKTSSDHVIITLGSEGALVHTGVKSADPKVKWLTDRLPALNFTPIDIAGAGDALLSVTALSLAADSSIWAAAFLGSVGSAIQVSRVGNSPLTQQELRSTLMAM